MPEVYGKVGKYKPQLSIVQSVSGWMRQPYVRVKKSLTYISYLLYFSFLILKKSMKHHHENGTHSEHDDCNDVKMYGSVVVGTKGQIVIPSEVRKALNINPGDSMCVVTKHGKAVGLVKMDDLTIFMEYMQREIDSFRAMGQKGDPALVDAETAEPHMTRNE